MSLDPTITAGLFHTKIQGVPPSITGDRTSLHYPKNVPSTEPTPPGWDLTSTGFQTQKFNLRKRGSVFLNCSTVMSPWKSSHPSVFLYFPLSLRNQGELHKDPPISMIAMIAPKVQFTDNNCKIPAMVHMIGHKPTIDKKARLKLSRTLPPFELAYKRWGTHTKQTKQNKNTPQGCHNIIIFYFQDYFEE